MLVSCSSIRPESVGTCLYVSHNDQGDSLVRLEADGPVTLSFKQAPRDSQQVRLEVIFSYIEQAQMENQAKDQIWALVKKDMPLAYKMLELQGLGLDPEVIEPVMSVAGGLIAWGRDGSSIIPGPYRRR